MYAGSWWPILKELEERSIPVIRFTQYQGDMVWLNPGTVHWVQADTSCNNVAWNVGPITAHQFKMAWERYQWNIQEGVRSIVPMLNLTWNLARSASITDVALHNFIKALLQSNMDQTYQVLNKAKEAGLPVYRQDKAEGEISHACHKCQIEVYNILFVSPQDDQYQVFCMACASKQKREIKVLQQFDMSELETIFQSFKLQQRTGHLSYSRGQDIAYK